jgi:glycerate kinase
VSFLTMSSRNSYAVVAPDKFKLTLTAGQVARAMAAGLRSAGVGTVSRPVADGGEGTAPALVAAAGGTWRLASVTDPLGRPVEGRFGMLDAGDTAVLDAAEASGLWRVSPDERDPWRASTRGTGQLIAAAARAGAKRIVVAAGGTATLDGGAGALEVLSELRDVPDLVVACDVTTPWERAAAVFGLRKGASPDDVPRLAARLDDLAKRAPRDPRGVPRTGCAGGLSGALWAWFGAELLPGAPLVLDAIGFDELLRGAAFVVTGEGRIDAQSLFGNAVGEVARRCAETGVPCDAIVGCNDLDEAQHRALGLRRILEAGDEPRIRVAARALAGLHFERRG